MPADRFDVAIVGGGFYGARLALHLRRHSGQRVVLFERDPELLTRASFHNQARVHNGYHYPRSLLTGLRSHFNFPRFSAEYADCVATSFESYYAIARTFSQVSAAQFRRFCERIGAPLQPAPREVRLLFDPHRIEDVFRVEETAFDALLLRARLARDLEHAGVVVRTGTEVTRLVPKDPGFAVHARDARGDTVDAASRVNCCTYARINHLLHASGLPLIPVKHEITEMALVQAPPEFTARAITVMCGPFFSLFPFPARGLHTLSHVRYTPHCEWHDGGTTAYRDPYETLARFPRKSRHVAMIADGARYAAAVARCVPVESLWEVKTVLPRSEVDDSRPILLRRDHGAPGLTLIMGSKIDNIYDALDSHELLDTVRTPS